MEWNWATYGCLAFITVIFLFVLNLVIGEYRKKKFDAFKIKHYEVYFYNWLERLKIEIDNDRLDRALWYLCGNAFFDIRLFDLVKDERASTTSKDLDLFMAFVCGFISSEESSYFDKCQRDYASAKGAIRAFLKYGATHGVDFSKGDITEINKGSYAAEVLTEMGLYPKLFGPGEQGEPQVAEDA